LQWSQQEADATKVCFTEIAIFDYALSMPNDSLSGFTGREGAAPVNREVTCVDFYYN
jgi:hypothetical protein